MEEMDLLRTLESTWMGGASSMRNADFTGDDEQAISEFRLCLFGTVPFCDAGSPPVVSVGKRLKSLDNGGVSGRTTLCEADRLQRSSEETELLLSSCHTTDAAACGKVLDPFGSKQNVPYISTSKGRRYS